jgi:hypothetical protein
MVMRRKVKVGGCSEIFDEIPPRASAGGEIKTPPCQRTIRSGVKLLRPQSKGRLFGKKKSESGAS